jgi:predicted aconitase
MTGPAALQLTGDEQAMLDGDRGEAVALAMRIVVALARMVEAERLLSVTRAHVDSCLFHGRSGLDLALRLADDGGTVAVPTTLNVGSLDLRHPDRVKLVGREHDDARALMAAYERMGCHPTWTCAPYQLHDRPALGEQIAWAESNAIVFANSVLGARTERYGDITDICAALTGRVPDAGLHRDEHRRGEVLFRLDAIPTRLREDAVLFPLVGHVVGDRTGTRVPVVEGLPSGVGEDALKALGAATASSGGVALFHAVGLTPEAPDLATALAGRHPVEVVDVTVADLAAARDELSTTSTDELAGVAVGTPHASLAELERIAALFDAEGAASAVPFHVNAGRDTWDEAVASGLAARLEARRVVPVLDTCTYITPVLDPRPGAVMTDSAKWAWYAPGNIGVEVVFASLPECVRSAVRGRVTLDGALLGALGVGP